MKIDFCTTALLQNRNAIKSLRALNTLVPIKRSNRKTTRTIKFTRYNYGTCDKIAVQWKCFYFVENYESKKFDL